MPGSVGVTTGYIYRDLGKGISTSAALQRMGKGGALAAGGGQISVQLSAAGVGNGADTTEDTLFTVTLPPNTLSLPGQCISLLAWGSITATSATKNAKLYFGSSIAVPVTYLTTTTGSWQIYMMVFKVSANVQTALTEADSVGAATSRNVTVTAGSETDTAAIVCKVTGQTTAGGANVVTANGFQVCGMN